MFESATFVFRDRSVPDSTDVVGRGLQERVMLAAVPSRRMSEDGVVGACVSAPPPLVGQTAVGAITLVLGETLPARRLRRP